MESKKKELSSITKTNLWLILYFLIACLLFAGIAYACGGGRPYKLCQATEYIERVEIVYVEYGTRPPDGVVIGTVPEAELEEFLEEFFLLKAHSYLGDPYIVGERCVKFCYTDGTYELIGALASYVSADGRDRFVAFDSDLFEAFLDKYCE